MHDGCLTRSYLAVEWSVTNTWLTIALWPVRDQIKQSAEMMQAESGLAPGQLRPAKKHTTGRGWRAATACCFAQGKGFGRRLMILDRAACKAWLQTMTSPKGKGLLSALHLQHLPVRGFWRPGVVMRIAGIGFTADAAGHDTQPVHCGYLIMQTSNKANRGGNRASLS
jgi:hypothetical protein